MIEITFGYYSIINCLFNGLLKNGIEKFDALIHDHGLDYMFHGMYLPNENIAEYFINNVKFRLIEINFFSFLNEKEKKKRGFIFPINRYFKTVKNFEYEKVPCINNDFFNYLLKNKYSDNFNRVFFRMIMIKEILKG